MRRPPPRSKAHGGNRLPSARPGHASPAGNLECAAASSAIARGGRRPRAGSRRRSRARSPGGSPLSPPPRRGRPGDPRHARAGPAAARRRPYHFTRLASPVPGMASLRMRVVWLSRRTRAGRPSHGYCSRRNRCPVPGRVRNPARSSARRGRCAIHDVPEGANMG